MNLNFLFGHKKSFFAICKSNRQMVIQLFIFFTLVILINSPNYSQADEGMWPINLFPTLKVNNDHNFNVKQDWLNHTMLSSVRLRGGCSGGFVSESGLILTNHHCARSCIAQLSTENNDYIKNGFYAKKQNDELKCPDIEINQLVEISNVTAQIQKATQNKVGKAFNDLFQSISSKITSQCSNSKTKDKIHCEVVKLYNGGLYHLYKYKRYQDVRLVFAPEESIATFGGDIDNFNFPRYDFDVSFIRVYENDKPIFTQNYFPWSTHGAIENELTFVTGNPWKTSRMKTHAILETMRDIDLRDNIYINNELHEKLLEFQKKGDEQRRISTDLIFFIENNLKVYKGQQQVLMNSEFMNNKKNQEQEIINILKTEHSNLYRKFGTAWNEIEMATKEYRKISNQLTYIAYNSFGSDLYNYAQTLIRGASELQKNNDQRLPEFTDSNLPRIKQMLLSTSPINNELEILNMEFYLEKMKEQLPTHPLVLKLFMNDSASIIAKKIINGTNLKEIKEREKLFNGGIRAIKNSQDPLIIWAQLIDQFALPLRKKFEKEIKSKIDANNEKIATVFFKLYGKNISPDATSTLRITYGQVKGYKDHDNEEIAPFTKLAGAFERSTNVAPFIIPDSWQKNKNQLNLDTPFNFVSTHEMIGGFSGSPMINTKSELVGLAFDGNKYSISGAFYYDSNLSRTVSVHSNAILELLDKVYGTERLLSEITSPTSAKTKE